MKNISYNKEAKEFLKTVFHKVLDSKDKAIWSNAVRRMKKMYSDANYEAILSNDNEYIKKSKKARIYKIALNIMVNMYYKKFFK